MNLFLLLAVPLFTVILWRLRYSLTTWTDILPTVAFSAVWSLILLVVTVLVSGWVLDTGNLWTTALGDLVVFAALVPGSVLALHLIPALTPKVPRTSELKQLDLLLLLALVFSALGFGEFLATNRQNGLWELFLVPLLRMIWLASLPWLMGRWLAPSESSSTNQPSKGLTLAGLIVLALAYPPLHALWLSGWGWLSTGFLAVMASGILIFVLGLRLPPQGKKNAAPTEGGETNPEVSGR